MKTRRAAPGAVLVLALVLAGCAADPADTGPEASCGTEDSLPAKTALAFADGYRATGRYGLTEAASEDGWLMAVEYTAKEAGTAGTGVWFTPDLISGQLFSVDENAVKVSSWGLGEEDDAAGRRADPNYDFALGCLH